MVSFKVKSISNSPVSNLGQPEDLSPLQIVSIGKDRWRISTCFSTNKDHKQAIPEKLVEIKRQISAHYNHPENLLQYKKLLKKEMREDGSLCIEIVIERLPIPTGVPQLVLKPLVSDAGVEYSDMLCLVDLYPLDSFDKQTDLAMVKQILKKEGIEKRLIQWELVEDSIKQVIESQVPIFKLEVARGKFPSKGSDAKLDFSIPLKPEAGQAQKYLEDRKVNQGDILCRKTNPEMGKESGCSVKGKSLPARKGWDVTLIAKRGVTSSTDNTEISAAIDGLVTVHQKEKSLVIPGGRIVIPHEITFQVDPVKVIKGGRAKELTTEEAIEVAGSLKNNSHIISQSEVHVHANVTKDSQIQAGGGVTVGGKVLEGTIISDRDIFTQAAVIDSKLTAKGKVFSPGPVINSKIGGEVVDIGKVEGSEIQAQSQVTVNQIGMSSDGKVSEVKINRSRFLDQKIEENLHFIDTAEQNLGRLYKLFGTSNLNNLTPPERTRIIMNMLRVRKQKRKKPYTIKEVETLKQLLASAPTLTCMIQKKQEENEQITRELEAADDSTKVFIVRERVTARTIVSIGDYQTSLEPTESGVCVRADGTGIFVEALPESLETIDSMLTAIESMHEAAEEDSSSDDIDTPDYDASERDILKEITDSDI